MNGQRDRREHPAVPVTPQEIAASAAAAVAAGATDLHVHIKDDEGRDTLDPGVVGRVLTTVRAACPGVTVGLTTGAWTGEPSTRRRLVAGWTTLPDHASVNWHEDGAEAVARVLLDRGVGVEAGLWTGTDGIERFRRSPLRDQVLRVLIEVTDRDATTAVASARTALTALADVPLPLLVHGEDGAAWPVLALARRRGCQMRIGLEDTLVLPDGNRAADNAELVAAALGAHDHPGGVAMG